MTVQPSDSVFTRQVPALTIGSTAIVIPLRSRTPQEKARLLAEMVERVWPKVESGEIRPTIYAVLPIQQAEEAHALMRSGKHVGKIVLTVKEA